MVDSSYISKISEGFFLAAKESNNLIKYQEQLRFFNWIIKKDDALRNFLLSPFNDFKDQEKVISNLFSNLFSAKIVLFINLIIEKRLISSFKDILDNYIKLVNNEFNVARGNLYTPFKLQNKQLATLQDIFAKKLNKNVIFKQIIDKSLIAGIKIIIDGSLYEYSINSKLDETCNKLLNKKE